MSARAERLRDRLIGAWRLVSFEYVLANGAIVEAYGHEPVGLLIYDPSGHVSAQIMNTERPRFVSGDRRKGTRDELHAAVEGYIAYFGTFEVLEDESCVVHVEAGDVFPNAVGTRQRRLVTLEGDLLELKVPPVMLGGERMTATIRWKRIVPTA